MMMFNGVNNLDITQDEIALNDIESLRQDIEAIGNPNMSKPSIPLLDFSKLKGSSTQAHPK
jgi:hypothetical protein